jgi:hypothetical protein
MSKYSKLTGVFTVLAAHCAIIVLTGACAGADNLADPVSDEIADNQTDGGVYLADPCLFDGDGCPCEQENEKIECGRVYRRSGDYTSCIVGHRECVGGAWTECSMEVVVEVDSDRVPPSYTAYHEAEEEADSNP